MRVTISINRHRLRSNQETGAKEPVIRICSDSGAVHTREAHIKGESRVVYRPEGPQTCGARAWIETDSEVVPIEAQSSEPLGCANVAPPVRPSTLGTLLESGLLQKASAQLELLVTAQPDRADLWRRLGDTARQVGDLPRAAAAYERYLALEPGDIGIERALAILRSDPLPRPPASWPARYVRYNNFIPLERLQELMEFTVNRHEQFVPTQVVGRDGKNVLRPDVRWCTNYQEIDSITEWFMPLVQARLPEIMERLHDSPFRVELRDCKLTYYGDGSFFRPHIDRGPGVESRVFGFIYYFYFPPRRFNGGGLAIYDWDLEKGEAAANCTTLIPEMNQLVVLSSHCWHEVLPVRCATSDWDAGRFTLNGWINRVG